MTLAFPNPSRFYDATRGAVRFWGYDNAMEASFYMPAEALRRLQPDIQPNEDRLLSVFDANRDLICAAATKVYARGNKGSYELSAADF